MTASGFERRAALRLGIAAARDLGADEATHLKKQIMMIKTDSITRPQQIISSCSSPLFRGKNCLYIPKKRGPILRCLWRRLYRSDIIGLYAIIGAIRGGSTQGAPPGMAVAT